MGTILVRRQAALLPILMIWAVTGLAAAPTPQPDQVSYLTDALEARLGAAEHALAVVSQVALIRTRPRLRGGEGRAAAPNHADPHTTQPASGASRLLISNVMSEILMQTPGASWNQRWIGYGPADSHNDQFEFISQGPEDTQTTLMIMRPPAPIIQTSIKEAGTIEPRCHSALGLLWRTGGEGIHHVKPPFTVLEGESIGGCGAVVVSGVNGEVWLAPDLGYAPLRCRVRGGDGDEGVTDYWGYYKVGMIYLPSMSLGCTIAIDGERREVVTEIFLTRLHDALVGAEPVAERSPARLRVPLFAGGALTSAWADPLESTRFVGQNPHDIWVNMHENDGAAWGISLKALEQDLDLTFPGDPILRP